MKSTDQNRGEIVLYRTDDGRTSLGVRLENETVWLTQAQLVQLFQRSQPVISRHINSVFKEKELDTKSNMQKMHSANSWRAKNLSPALARADVKFKTWPRLFLMTPAVPQ